MFRFLWWNSIVSVSVVEFDCFFFCVDIRLFRFLWWNSIVSVSDHCLLLIRQLATGSNWVDHIYFVFCVSLFSFVLNPYFRQQNMCLKIHNSRIIFLILRPRLPSSDYNCTTI